MELSKKELLDKKIAHARQVIGEAIDRYGLDKVHIAWTGGKDSTLVLHIAYLECQARGIPMPKCFCIDEGDMFDEVREFIDKHAATYNVEVEMIHNSDVSQAAGGVLGAEVRVEDLNERNQAEVERLGYDEDTFAYEPESFVGNHLMKTVTLNMYLERTGIAGFMEGIRWDEQGARANETYFSPRRKTSLSPEHMRVCPILHFTERDVWDAHFYLNIPICSLYNQGYRSLGARVTTTKNEDVPAWEQDLENTSERGGRRQDKEHLMAKLRELGYM